jgi:two-component system, NarL family, response regulator LiaR
VTREPIRLLVVSTQEVVAAGVIGMLAGHPAPIRVVHHSWTGDDPGEVDVVLYDALTLVGGDVAELERLVEASKGVVVLGRDLRPDLATRALEHGALTIVSMYGGADDLVAAVEAVYAGEIAELGAPAREWLAQADGLTEREADILELVARGMTNAEIARRLYLSINTVKTYIRTAYRKIGVDRRSQAVGWAMDHGFSSSSVEDRRERERDAR